MGIVKEFSGEMVRFSSKKAARLIKRVGKMMFFMLKDREK